MSPFASVSVGLSFMPDDCVRVLPISWCKIGRFERSACESPIVHFFRNTAIAQDGCHILCESSLSHEISFDDFADFAIQRCC